jgi:rare lipoprotein A
MGHGNKMRLRGLFMTVGLMALCVFWAVSSRAADQASWYGEKHRGLLMANGERFDPDRFTAASWLFDLGTKVVVAHGDRSVVVEITDRGPAKRLFRAGRIIDLSRAAFERLADPDVGLIDVTITKL